MSAVNIPISGFSLAIDSCHIPAPAGSGVVIQKKNAFVQPQSITFAAPGGWKAVTGASIALTNISTDRAVHIRMNVLLGRDIAGIVSFAVFRDGQMLSELPGAYVKDNGDIVQVSPEWIDTGHGGGDQVYDFRWKAWSGTTFIGQRGDGQYIANVPGLVIAEEFQP